MVQETAVKAIAVALLISGCGSASAGCAAITDGPALPGVVPVYRVTVRVQDPARLPIVGAIVKIGAIDLGRTGSDGEITGPVARGRYVLSVTAEGYQGQLWVIDVVETGMQFGVGLDRASMDGKR